MLNHKFKKNFPFFDNNKVVYLNSAATSLKPREMISVSEKFSFDDASQPIKQVCEKKIRKILRCDGDAKIFFIPGGTTGCINLIALALSQRLQTNYVWTSELEHHSNYLPWLQYFPNRLNILSFSHVNFTIDANDFFTHSKKGDVLSLSAYSNVLGPLFKSDFSDLKRLINCARSRDVISIVDAAQVVLHSDFSWNKIKPDFLCFSAHKVYGPTNLGILVIRKEVEGLIRPYLELFSVPTLQIAEFTESLKFILRNRLHKRWQIKRELFFLFIKVLRQFPCVRIISNQSIPGHIISFVVVGAHPHDVVDLLAQHNIIVRGGNLCAKPLHDSLNIDSSVRVSLAFYNTQKDVNNFRSAFIRVLYFLGL